MARRPAVVEGKQFGVRLTAAEDAIIHRERRATGPRSLSSVFEQAIVDLLAERDEIARAGGLRTPSLVGVPKDGMIPRQFRLRVATLRLIHETTTCHGWTKQAIARAALHRLARAAEERDRGAGAGAGAGAGEEGDG